MTVTICCARIKSLLSISVALNLELQVADYEVDSEEERWLLHSGHLLPLSLVRVCRTTTDNESRKCFALITYPDQWLLFFNKCSLGVGIFSRVLKLFSNNPYASQFESALHFLRRNSTDHCAKTTDCSSWLHSHSQLSLQGWISSCYHLILSWNNPYTVGLFDCADHEYGGVILIDGLSILSVSVQSQWKGAISPQISSSQVITISRLSTVPVSCLLKQRPGYI